MSTWRIDRPGFDSPALAVLRRSLAESGVDVTDMADDELRAAAAEASRAMQALGAMLAGAVAWILERAPHR